MGTVTGGLDAWLANRPFIVVDFRALWRSTTSERQSARKSKTINGRLATRGGELLYQCRYFGNTELKWVNDNFSGPHREIGFVAVVA